MKSIPQKYERYQIYKNEYSRNNTLFRLNTKPMNKILRTKYTTTAHSEKLQMTQ